MKRAFSTWGGSWAIGRATAIFWLALLAAWFLSLSAIALAAQEREVGDEKRILVVVSSRHPSYERCLLGLKDRLAYKRPDLQVDTVILEELASGRGLESHRGYDLVVPVGTSATAFVIEHFEATPVLFTMVLDAPASFFLRKDVAGLCLDIPLSNYVAWFRILIPGFRTLGVLYTDSSRHLVADLERQARRCGIRLTAIEVKDLAGLGEDMARIARNCQALLAIPDEHLYNRIIARRIIYYAIKQHLPFAGLSVNFTRSGALFSLDLDYWQVGSQTARLVMERLYQGVERRGCIHPDTVIAHLNLRTARLIGLDLDQDTINMFELVVH